jgi:retinol dehydrogenase-12
MSNDKTALVTDGTSGVGLSVLPALIKAGFFVHFVGTNVDKGRAIEASLNGDGERARFHQLDLSNIRAVHDFAGELREALPSLDLLLNVAGVMLPTRQLTAEGFEKTFAINYLSAVVLSRALTPLLAQAPGGRIANVAGRPDFALTPGLDMDDLELAKKYSGMKAAILSIHAKTVMTEVMAAQLKPQGIDVNCFHPGAIKGGVGRNMALPFRALFAVANLFMAKTSKSGVYVSTAEELKGVTGQFFEGTKGQTLSFDADYKDRLVQETERRLEQVLGGNAVAA